MLGRFALLALLCVCNASGRGGGRGGGDKPSAGARVSTDSSGAGDVEPNVKCTKHTDCPHEDLFCELLGPQSGECHDCTECEHDHDAIDGKCPANCDGKGEHGGKDESDGKGENDGKGCQLHTECADAERVRDPELAATAGFCSSENVCATCGDCHGSRDSIDGKCPHWCPRPPCTAHAECVERVENFCSKVSAKCEDCNICRDQDAVGGACPASCPHNVLKCHLNTECKDNFFCSLSKRCTVCEECHQDFDASDKAGCLRRCGVQAREDPNKDEGDEDEHDEM